MAIKAIPRLRILIVGGDGAIGHELNRFLAATGHDVIATTRHRDRVDSTTLFLDMAESQTALPRVDVAVICAAITRFSDCRNFPEVARRVNVTAPVALSRELASRGTRTLLLSTSAVFDCLSPHVKENHRAAPRSVYGRLKAEAEVGVLALGNKTTVLRLTKILRCNSGVMTQWISDLRRGETIQAFADHRLCPITLNDALEAIGAIIEHGESGVYQVSGAADISFEEAARHLAARIGVPAQRVIAAKAAANGLPIDEITPFTSLDTSRLSALTGYVPLPPQAVIDKVFAASFALTRPQ